MSESNTPTGAPTSAPAPQNTSQQSQAPQTGAPSQEQAAALQDAAANGTPKEQAVAKKMLKEIRYKVDGQEHIEQLGFEIPEEHAEYMQKQLSLNKGAQKRMQQYGQLENEIKQFVGQMKTDTKGTLAKLGIDPKQFAAMMLEEEIKLNSMSPEQREREELKAKLKSLEDERKKERDDYSKKELERQTQVEYERISTKIEKAIDTSGLPKSPATVKRIANYMLAGNNMGIKFEPEELVDIVQQDLLNDMQSVAQALGPEKIEQLFGKDILKQIRQKNVAKAKSTGATAKAGIKDVTTSAKKEDKPVEKKTYKQLFGF